MLAIVGHKGLGTVVDLPAWIPRWRFARKAISGGGTFAGRAVYVRVMRLGENAAVRRLVVCLGGALVLLGLVLASPATARPGSLDSGFGENGLVVEDVGGRTWPSAAVVQPDGQVVVATSHRIARFRWDGQRDDGFVDRGLPVAGLVGLPDGGLVRLGGDELERMLPDGTRDSSFAVSSGGTASVPGVKLGTLAVDSDERIVAAGHDTVTGALAVVRFMPDGRLDPGFGSGGIVRTAVSAAGATNLDIGRSVAIAPDGRIVVGGSAGNKEDCTGLLHCWGPYLKAVVVRYLPEGTLDGGFGRGGVFEVKGGSWGSADSVRVRPDGDVLFIPGPPTGALEPEYGFPFVVAALTSQGQLDGSFAGDGVSARSLRMHGKRANQGASQLTVTPQGNVVACGWISRSESAPGRFLVGLLGADGNPVRSFGRGGFVRTHLPGKRYGGAAALALAPHGRVYVAGVAGRSLAVARYHLR
jgi:uncharacterized delta-60 repeat protein